MEKFRKKTKIRKKILYAFYAVLFASFLLVSVVFNMAMAFIEGRGGYDFLGGQHFAFRASWVALILAGLIFIIAAVVTFFVSNTITRPIEKLSKFAMGLGKGNFVPNEFEFEDEELDELNTALNNSARQLAIYDNQQRIFFQNVSHELRTPLMSIKCYAEGISVGIMQPAAAAETILQETDRLTQLVQELLYISQIDNISASHTKNETNLAGLVRESAARQQAIADKKQIKFILNFNKEIIVYKCVEELMSRAFDNLISNAIRHASSEIVISCEAKNDGIKIAVNDDGNGIDDAILPHIFERFYKGDGGNTGIGLSIVKSIIVQHGGTIHAINLSGGGASFVLNLPI